MQWHRLQTQTLFSLPHAVQLNERAVRTLLDRVGPFQQLTSVLESVLASSSLSWLALPPRPRQVASYHSPLWLSQQASLKATQGNPESSITTLSDDFALHTLWHEVHCGEVVGPSRVPHLPFPHRLHKEPSRAHCNFDLECELWVLPKKLCISKYLVLPFESGYVHILPFYSDYW